MSTIKQLSVYRDNNWLVDDIGTDVGNITLNSTASLTDILPVITLTPNKALISDSSGIIAASNVTSTLLGYLSGATANIQTQIDGIYTILENMSITQYSSFVSNVSIPNSIFTTVCLSLLEIPIGQYLIVFRIVYAANATGIRMAFIGTSNTSTGPAASIADTRQAISGYKIILTGTGLISNMTQRKLYLRTEQTSGSNLNIESAYLNIHKIK